MIEFHKSTEPFEFDESRWFVGEKPEVLDAFRVLSKEGYYIAISGHDYDMRKARLGRPTDKPSSDTPSTLNPALKEAASQFNDALLDEQAKKIARLKKIIHKKNMKIEELRKESSEHLRGKVKVFYENVDLEGKLKDKDAVLSDVAEELRLSKIREKNLTEVCQKYMKENEDLKEKLANKVVDKIDAQALKSAESALAWKEKVIAEKNEEIVDLGRKLNTQKDLVDDISLKYDGAKYNLKLRIEECEELKKLLADKVGNGIDWKRNADAIKLYVNRASHERLWNSINQDICNEKELSFIINHEGKRVKYALRFDGTDIVYECSDPDKKPRIPTPEISEEELMKLQEKVCADIAEEGTDLTGVIIIKSEK